MVEDEVVLTVWHAVDVDICSSAVDMHDVIDDVGRLVICGARGVFTSSSWSCRCLSDIQVFDWVLLTGAVGCLQWLSYGELVLTEGDSFVHR